MSDEDRTPEGSPAEPGKAGGEQAGGLADYFSVDPVIVRIAFAVSVFFGGLGALPTWR